MTVMTQRSSLDAAPVPDRLAARSHARRVTTSAPLSIIHLAKHCGRGNGNVHVAVDLACEQARLGHPVVFASAGGSFVGLLEQHGVRHILLPQDQRRPVEMLRSFARLNALARSYKLDIIHAHMMGGALIGYAASCLTGVPMVATVHNSFDKHSQLMRLADRVVAVSHAEAGALKQRKFPQDRLRVVQNAPVGSARRQEPADTSDLNVTRPCIALVCGLHRRKGVADVIHAVATLFADFPEWTLQIAGEGPDREELEQLAASLGIADQVTFLGYVGEPDIIYRQADIFVLASHADPGSLTIGEARAAGCAIVATNVGGTPEMLDFGAAGRLVRPGQPLELAVQLRGLMQDRAARDTLSCAARTGVERFHVSRLACDYDAIYRDAMNPAAGVPRVKR